jgi:nucleotide-binding universal stress UspA family protein
MRIPHIPPRKIVVAVDFSPASCKAWFLAHNIARALGAYIEALFVYEVQAIPDPLAAGVAVTPLTEGLKSQLAEKLRAELGQDAAVTIRQGLPIQGILDFARERGADMIAIGTHGRAGLKRALLGSVAEYVTRHSPVPVLTAHDQWSPVRSILVPLNFARYSLNGLYSAAELARLLCARLDVVHVAEEPYSAPALQAAFDAAVKKLPPALLEKPPKLLKLKGNAAERIVDAGVDYDLIALVAHRRSMFRDLVLGTTAERVLRYSFTPVLALPDSTREIAGRLLKSAKAPALARERM